MQDQELPQEQSGFVQSRLPWLLAGSALLLYLITINHWVSLTSLPVVAQVTGWDWWSPNLQAPVFYLFTLPIQLMPASWQPIALNILSALCAAGVLGLLARCVAILPHDRTRDQRQRESSDFSYLTSPSCWLPPVLAVLACGLQLTFWEHATTATGELLNLLMFAYMVRCVLEHRLDEQDRWLYHMAFVFGIACTNNWAMLALLPVMLVSLIWIKGMSFFRLAVLLRMAGLVLLGLCLYVVLPTLEYLKGVSSLSIWQLIKSQVGYQAQMVSSFPKYVILLCGLTSLLPAFFIGIRWPSTSGDTSIIGTIISQLMFRVIHLLFLAACVWVMFDPPFSPRELGFGFPFLPFYFLSALSIGYFSGYFLLVGAPDHTRRRHRQQGLDLLLTRALFGVVWVAFLALPIMLAARNYTKLRANSGRDLKQLAQHLVDSIPDRSSLVLSDEQTSLLLVSALSTAQGKSDRWLPVDTRFLQLPRYLKLLHQHSPQQWPDAGDQLREPIELVKLVRFLQRLGQSNDLYYLHPSASFYSEVFYRKPQGLVYRMNAYTPDMVYAPVISQQEFTANQGFWNQRTNFLEQLPAHARQNDTDLILSDARFVANFYSRAINAWAVELQRYGRWDLSLPWLKMAVNLNSNNAAAIVNLGYNEKQQATPKQPYLLDEKTSSLIRKYQTISTLLRENGPVDEPNLCLRMGEEYNVSSAGSPAYLRQAAQAFRRVLELDPQNVDAAIWLGNVFLKGKQPEEAIKMVHELQAQSARLSVNQKSELVRMHVWALFAQTNFTEAEQVLEKARAQFPTDAMIPETLFQLNLMTGRFTNALAAIEMQLQLDPNNVKTLLNKGALCIQLKAYEQAIPPLTQVLQREPKNDAALMNRAIAELQANKLDDAEKDYQQLLAIAPTMHAAYYGLGEIADRRKQVQKTISNFELFLKYAPKETMEIQAVQERLRTLKASQ
jgi:tetratricopeptide (TPR) repeat protein